MVTVPLLARKRYHCIFGHAMIEDMTANVHRTTYDADSIKKKI